MNNMLCHKCGNSYESVYVMTDWFTNESVHICKMCRSKIVRQIANDAVVMRLIARIDNEGKD